MAIIITFPNPADSPTGQASIRLRYSFDGGDVRLQYAHGKRQMTRDDWCEYADRGATVTADSPQEKNIVKSALGVDL